jgi:hypothetical protein
MKKQRSGAGSLLVPSNFFLLSGTHFLCGTPFGPSAKRLPTRIAMLRNTLMVFGFVLLILASMAAPDATAANSCQPLEDTIGKLATTPTHIYSTVSDGLGNKPTAIEMIYVRGAVYVKMADKWMRTNFTTPEMTHQSLEKQKQGLCHYEKDESVGGQAAAVYSSQSQSGGAKAQLWISKSTGLPLREEVDVDSGGKGRNSHTSMRYEYGNVQAPTN